MGAYLSDSVFPIAGDVSGRESCLGRNYACSLPLQSPVLSCDSHPFRGGNINSTSRQEYGVASNTSPTAPTAGGIAYHRFYRQTQLLWSETLDQTDYGYWYWATDNTASLTYESGADTDVRSAFTSSGVLADTNDTNFRAISDSYPTFAFALDLGSIEASAVSTLFTLGLTQEQAIQFNGASGVQALPSLWTSYFPTELDAVSQESINQESLIAYLTPVDLLPYRL